MKFSFPIAQPTLSPVLEKILPALNTPIVFSTNEGVFKAIGIAKGE